MIVCEDLRTIKLCAQKWGMLLSHKNRFCDFYRMKNCVHLDSLGGLQFLSKPGE